jgi:outer membrane receptor protein involved in Fe transport
MGSYKASVVRAAAVGLCSLILLTTAHAHADAPSVAPFDIPPQGLSSALGEFARQSQREILYAPEIAAERRSGGVHGTMEPAAALRILLKGSGLSFATTPAGAILVGDPSRMPAAVRTDQSKSGPGAGEDQEAPRSSPERFRVAQVDQGSTTSSSTLAQTTAPTMAPSALETIVVTARRREENINQVPASITAFSQQTMDELNIKSLADLATITPGIFVAPTSGPTQDSVNFAIRGIQSQGNAPTTQFYIDETPIAIRQVSELGVFSMSPQPLIFDLDRVEVLRGPQGTLFGASAMGGAIRFITPQPNLTASSGFAKAEGGYTDGGDASYDVGAAFGAPLIERRLGFRVSAWYQSTGGFIDQVDPFTGEILKKNANSSEAYVVRPAITWAPSDALSITPAAYLQHIHSDHPNTYWLDNVANAPSGRHVWGGTLQPLTDDLRVGSLAIAYQVAGLSIHSDTSYLDRRLHENTDITQILQFIFGGTSFMPGLESFRGLQTDISSNQAWMQEIRVTSQDPASSISWVAGAFYRNSKVSLEQLWAPDLSPITEQISVPPGQNSDEYFGVPNYIYNGQALNAYTAGTARDISEALFGDVTVKFGSHVNASAGIRVEHLIVTDQTQTFDGPVLGGPLSNILPDATATPVTPHATLTYQFTDDDMVYASAGKGFRPGGGNVIIVPSEACAQSLHQLGYTSEPTTYGPDHLWSYEVGTKDSFFNRRLTVQGSIYYTDWRDIQSGVTPNNCYQPFFVNRKRAVSQGFDLQLSAALTNDLRLNALVGYTNAYYPDATYDTSTPPVLQVGAGDKLGIIPWTFAVNAEYLHDMSALWAQSRLYLRLDYRYTGAPPPGNPSIPGYDPVAQANADPAYGVLNIRLGLVHARWDLSLYLNNAGNSDPVLAWFHIGPSDTLHRASTIQPRTAGLTMWYRF